VNSALGWIEAIAVPVSVVWFLVAAARRSPSLKAATIAVAVLALTVAQPFGATLTPITDAQWAADGGHEASPTGWHALKLGPVPVAAFTVFSRGVVNFQDSGPTARTYVRTWTGPLTNGTGAKAGRDERLLAATLRQRPDGGYDLREEIYGVNEAEMAKMQTFSPPGNYTPTYQQYRIGFGIASISGLLYWLFAIPAVGYVAYRARKRAAVRKQSGLQALG